MTRINIIEPADLTKRHLIAEYKEITQFLHIIRGRRDKKHPMNDIPKEYTLSGGHCLFFFDKGKYLFDRFISLRDNLIFRGINVDESKYQERLSRIKSSYGDTLFNGYTPNKKAYSIVINRISERIHQKPELYPDKEVFFNSIVRYN